MKTDTQTARSTGMERRLLAAALAGALLVGGGVFGRQLEPLVRGAIGQVAPLKEPLATLPTQLGEWSGRDVPLDPLVTQVANFDDEYVYREYDRRTDGRRVAAFVGYVGRPRATLGHRPDRCYTTQGWTMTSESRFEFRLDSGRPAVGILYQFRSPGIGATQSLVLSTCVVNGRFRASIEEFTRYNARNPRLMNEQASYLLRMQLVTTATGDPEADVAALVALASRAHESLESILPYVSDEPAQTATPRGN